MDGLGVLRFLNTIRRAIRSVQRQPQQKGNVRPGVQDDISGPDARAALHRRPGSGTGNLFRTAALGLAASILLSVGNKEG